jgi:hypothetical protein
LNLDITTPAIESGINAKPLPVLIWIHGMNNRSQERRMLIICNRPGGSQTLTFGSAASKVCGQYLEFLSQSNSPSLAVHVPSKALIWLGIPDMTKIVTDSASAGSPFIAVNISYRLNMFSFGTGKGEVNLGFKDQRLAIDWVVAHIAGFGGDSVRPSKSSN